MNSKLTTIQKLFPWFWYKQNETCEPTWIKLQEGGIYHQQLGLASLFRFSAKPVEGMELPEYVGPLRIAFKLPITSNKLLNLFINGFKREKLGELEKLFLDYAYVCTFFGIDFSREVTEPSKEFVTLSNDVKTIYIDAFNEFENYDPNIIHKYTIEKYRYLIREVCIEEKLDCLNIYNNASIYDEHVTMNNNCPDYLKEINISIRECLKYYQRTFLSFKEIGNHKEHIEGIYRKLYWKYAAFDCKKISLPEPKNICQNLIFQLKEKCHYFKDYLLNTDTIENKMVITKIFSSISQNNDIKGFFNVLSSDGFKLIADVDKGVKIDCNSLKKKYNCQKDCGVFSPVEMLHDNIFWDIHHSNSAYASIGMDMTQSNSQVPLPQIMFSVAAIASVIQEKIKFNLGNCCVSPNILTMFVAFPGEYNRHRETILNMFSSNRYLRSVEDSDKNSHVIFGDFTDQIHDTPVKFINQVATLNAALTILDPQGSFISAVQKRSPYQMEQLRLIAKSFDGTGYSLVRKGKPRIKLTSSIITLCSLVDISTANSFFCQSVAKQSGILSRILLFDGYYLTKNQLLAVWGCPIWITAAELGSIVTNLDNYTSQMEIQVPDYVYALFRKMLRALPHKIRTKKRDEPIWLKIGITLAVIIKIINQRGLSDGEFTLTPGDFSAGFNLLGILIVRKEIIVANLDTAPRVITAARIKKIYTERNYKYFRQNVIQRALGNKTRAEVEEGLRWLEGTNEIRPIKKICRLPGRANQVKVYAVNPNLVSNYEDSLESFGVSFDSIGEAWQ